MAHRSKLWKTLALVAVLLAIAGGFYFAQMRPVSVMVAAPERNVEARVFGIGTVEAQVVSRVGFQTAGRIVELLADQGEVVASGAVLARLDDSAQRAKVRKAEVAGLQAETAFAKANALKERSEIAYNQRKSVNQRRQSLVAGGSVSRETAEDTQAAEDIARADAAIAAVEVSVASALRQDAAAQLKLEQSLLDQHVLRAPFEARVIARHKELGSVANAGEAVFTLAEPASIWVRAFIDEAQAGSLALGQTAWVRLRSQPNSLVEAEIVRIDQENDRVSEERRLYVRCRACKPEHQIRYLGEQAEVEIVTQTIPEGVFAPARALEGFNGRTASVWTLEDGKLARRNVQTGARLLDGRVQIRDGLPAGAQVIVSIEGNAREGRAAKIASVSP